MPRRRSIRTSPRAPDDEGSDVMRSRIVAGLALALAVSAGGPWGTSATGDPVVPYDTLEEHTWGDRDAPGTVLFDIGDRDGVGSGPPNPARFVVPDGAWYRITSISTYHYNWGGGATPGTLALEDALGGMYGPWTASGLFGNLDWFVRPDVVIGPGTYTVIDSNPATWSYTARSGNAGHTRILAEATDPATTYQPDGRIRLGTGASLGNDVYNTTGAGQKIVTSASKGRFVTFRVAIGNDGSASDTFAVKGPGSAPGYWVRYTFGPHDITQAVVGGTWQTPAIAPGKSRVIIVTVKVRSSAAVGSRVTRKVRITSAADPAARDAVVLVVKRR
jgi:hypothetical protein